MRGFTLIEIFVAVFVLSIAIGAAFTFLSSGIKIQRETVGNQALLDQTSFLAEYLSRSLRQAQKSIGDGFCPPAGENYEVLATGAIEFLSREGDCRRISLDTDEGYGIIKEGKGNPPAITGSGIDIVGLTFVIDGEAETDDKQPRVTFSIHARSRSSDAEIFFQTTVSQRDFDVEE